MTVTDCWDETLISVVDVYRCSGKITYLRRQVELRRQGHSFKNEDAKSTSIRNVRKYVPHWTTSLFTDGKTLYLPKLECLNEPFFDRHQLLFGFNDNILEAASVSVSLCNAVKRRTQISVPDRITDTSSRLWTEIIAKYTPLNLMKKIKNDVFSDVTPRTFVET
jgi:hypothetical protein